MSPRLLLSCMPSSNCLALLARRFSGSLLAAGPPSQSWPRGAGCTGREVPKRSAKEEQPGGGARGTKEEHLSTLGRGALVSSKSCQTEDSEGA